MRLFAAIFLTLLPLAAAPVPDSQRRELLDALDLGQPGLEAVSQAVQAGDLAAAQTAFVAHLRARTIATWDFDPRSATVPDPSLRADLAAADNAARGLVTIVGIPREFAGNRIDWLHNETRARPGEPYNPEWQWQLCRMDFWSDLARAWRATGDERYVRAWLAQFRSFLAQCPAPGETWNTRDSAWRTLDSAIRINRTWPEAYHSFLHAPAVTESDLFLYALSTLRHARHLRAHPTSANWLATEMAALFTCGAIFPEFREAADWRRESVASLHRQIGEQFLPDGAHYEASTAYHSGALNSFLGVPRRARLTGRLGEIPADYIASLARGFDFSLRLLTPDRDLPRFNDAWPQDIPRFFRQHALDFFPGRADYQWVASDGRRGAPPTPPGASASQAFPCVGYFAMRSGWERDANYAAFDAGPLGFGHVHQDKLNLVLWSHGREILFDGGGGSYERSKWRAYATDTFSHNTVLVDGKPQRRQTRDREANVSRAPVDARWESTPAHDRVSAVYDEGYGSETDCPATHARRVFFLKPDIFVVADTLSPADDWPHAYEARWHLLPVAIRHDPATGAVLTTDPGLSNLAVVPLLADGLEVRAVSAQTEPELLGWHVRKDMAPQYVPATTVTHARRGVGIQHFLTLLLPLRPETDAAALALPAIERVSPRLLRVTLPDGRRLAIDTGDTPDSPLTVSQSHP